MTATPSSRAGSCRRQHQRLPRVSQLFHDCDSCNLKTLSKLWDCAVSEAQPAPVWKTAQHGEPPARSAARGRDTAWLCARPRAGRPGCPRRSSPHVHSRTAQTLQQALLQASGPETCPWWPQPTSRASFDMKKPRPEEGPPKGYHGSASPPRLPPWRDADKPRHT